ncbi:MAG: nuclear transport factor 2 family protein [Sphingomonadaceae bacterium]|nr:nuclear transport factor 2 family protein [Sphingomonadaceae bacterium]
MITPRDRLDILDVQNLYGHVLDRGLWDRLGQVFAADGIFDPSDVGLPPMIGMEEIRRKLIPLEERNPKRCHHSTNVIFLETAPASARVLSKYICNHATGIISYGEYEDDMIRTDAGWRIARRQTRRRALGRGEANAKFAIDWDALLANAPPPQPLREAPALGLSVEDRLALLDLQNLCGHVLDRGLWDRIGEIFAADGVFDPSNVGLPPMTGLAEIREKLIPLEDGAGPTRCHHSTNAVILAADGDRATMLSKYLCSAGPAAISYGEYEDECVRTAEGWRIARRKTFRRAAGVEIAGAPFTIEWDGLLANAPPRPALAAPPAPLPLSAEDRLDIEALLALYGHVFDRHWPERLDEVFTADGVFDPSSVGLTVVRGLNAFRDKFFHVAPGVTPGEGRAHHTTNVTILTATDTTARLLSKYVVRHHSAAVAFGEYEDDLVRTERGWRIARRKTYRRALGLDDGKSDRFSVDADGRLATA